MCCSSAQHAALISRSKNCCLVIRTTCLSGATYVPVECCFSELAVSITKIQLSVLIYNKTVIITNSNMTSFFRFVNKRASYRLGIIPLAHAPVHVTDFPVVNVHVDELSSVRIWQHKMCATLSANVNINCRLPIKVCYRICTLRHIKIEG